MKMDDSAHPHPHPHHLLYSYRLLSQFLIISFIRVRFRLVPSPSLPLSLISDSLSRVSPSAGLVRAARLRVRAEEGREPRRVALYGNAKRSCLFSIRIHILMS